MSRIGRAHRDDDSECQSPCVERSDAKRFRRTFSTRSSFISIFATVIAASSLTFTLWHRHSSHLNLFPFTAEARSLNGLSSEHSEAFSDPTKPMAEVKKKQQEPKEEPQRRTRNLDRTGVPEAMTTIRQDWSVVINNFMDTANIEMFSARKIREHFYSDVNNIQSTCLLVSIKNGNVTFTEKFSPKRHSRAASAKYIIEHIVKKKGSSLHGATFLVMLSDGHRPFIPTFGSARHWQSWNMMIPVPLGNSRGANIEWGTPLQGWDSYIDATITNGHKNYSWTSKREKAVFRGSLGMQKYTLGSCNEENGGKCVRATRWSQVNRGALYVKTQKEPELFDIAFSQHKLKVDSPPKQFEGAPPPSQTIKFQDFQKFKYILNVGSNQGKLKGQIPMFEKTFSFSNRLTLLFLLLRPDFSITVIILDRNERDCGGLVHHRLG